MPSNNYIEFNFDPETLQYLSKEGDYLYAMSGVLYEGSGGAPVVWSARNDYANNPEFQYIFQYQALLFPEPIAQGAQLTANYSADISAGQTLVVDSSGAPQVVDQGTSGAISITNRTSAPITAGVAQVQWVFATTFACTVQPGETAVITPGQSILFFFYPPYWNVGQVLETTMPAPGILLDIAETSFANITYSSTSGWSVPGNYASYTLVAEGADLASLLVTAPSKV
jgi:hypothetical protein